MTNLLEQGNAWLEQERTAHCSSQVSYFQGDVESLVDATFGRTDFEVEDGGRMTVAAHVWDFLILADDLGFDPTPGDAIETNGRRYEVLPFGDDVKGWRWSDPFRLTYRIHTRDIGESS